MRTRLVLMTVWAGAFAGRVAATEPLPTPLDRFLVGTGYTRLSVRADPAVPLLYVTARRGTRDLTLLLDTGSANCVLDARIAAELGLKLTDVPDKVPVLGGKVVTSMAWVTGVRVGRVEVPPFHWLSLDLGDAPPPAGGGRARPFDGLLGTGALQYFRGVLDVTAPALYLLDPRRQEPGLQGEWQGVAVVSAGTTHTGEYARKWRLRVEDIDARLTTPDAVADYKLSWKLSASPKELSFDTPDGASGYRAVYRLSGDDLTVAAPLCAGDDFRKRPSSVEPPATGGYTVVTYKRVKPAAPPPAK